MAKSRPIKRYFCVRLDPNNKQREVLDLWAGADRFIYNWSIGQKKQAIDNNHVIPTFGWLTKRLKNLIDKEEYWLSVIPINIIRNSISHCDAVFKRYSKKPKQTFPRFRTKKSQVKKFVVTTRMEMFDGDYIKVQDLGRIKLQERGYVPKYKDIDECTFFEKNGLWYASFYIEIKQPTYVGYNKVGVDLGIKTLAVCSNGQTYPSIARKTKYDRKIKLLFRGLKRCKKYSNNYWKIKFKIERLYERISNLRNDYIHKVTTKIVRENQVIVLEDLDVKEMLKNKRLAPGLFNASFGKFRRYIEYKASIMGKTVIIADKFYPSSKKCFKCGFIKHNLTLADRVYNCVRCGFSMDRDLMASKNLCALSTVSSTGNIASIKRRT